MPKLTLKNMGAAAIYGMVAVTAGGLLLRYFGDQPIIEDAKNGFGGNAKGLFS